MENWIVPCSVKFFDVVKHFENTNTIVWRRVSALKKDDIVYLYLGAPFSEVKYKCHVIDDDVPEDIVEQNPYAIKKSDSLRKSRYMQLELDYTYEDKALSLAKLREHGLGQTQTQARTDRRLQAFIESVNNDLGI